jgi:AraC-like DNA-binding protein
MKVQGSPKGELPIPAANPNGSLDLGTLFDAHIEREFADHDVNATMKTMVPEPYVYMVSNMMGGFGGKGVRRFYGTASEATSFWKSVLGARFLSRVATDKPDGAFCVVQMEIPSGAGVAPSVGFSDQSQFSHHFKRIIGVTPRKFQVSARIAQKTQSLSKMRRSAPFSIPLWKTKGAA